MQGLLLDHNPKRLEMSQLAFLEEGVRITGTGVIAVAQAFINRFKFDILLIDRHTVGKRFAELVRLAERRNPDLVTIALTPDVSGDTDRMIQAFPSMGCVLEADLSPNVVAKLAMGSVIGHTPPPRGGIEFWNGADAGSDLGLSMPVPAPNPAPAPVQAPEPAPAMWQRAHHSSPPPASPAHVGQEAGIKVTRLVHDEPPASRIVQADPGPIRDQAVAPVFSSIRKGRLMSEAAA